MELETEQYMTIERAKGAGMTGNIWMCSQLLDAENLEFGMHAGGDLI